MADLAQPGRSAPSRALSGIFCVQIGMALFVIQDGLMKGLLGDYSLWMLIAARGLVATLILVPIIVMLGAPHRLLTPLWRLHLLRASLFVTGFALFYAAFPFMGLAEVTTIFFAAPLFTAIMAALFLGEHIGKHRLICLVVGLLGVVIALNPTAETFHWVALLPLACAVMYAASQVIARQIGDQDTSLTMGLYTIVLAALLTLPLSVAMHVLFDLGPEFHHIRLDWSLPDADGLLFLSVLGLVGMHGYMFLSRAYQIAPASLIAPFDYSYLPIATIMAYYVFDEVPAGHTLVGMALIVVSGVYLGIREVRQARRVDDTAPTGEVVFVPGSPADGLAHASDIQERQAR